MTAREILKIVDFLKSQCGDDPFEMASVRINNDGVVAFAVGCHDHEHYTVDEFIALTKER